MDRRLTTIVAADMVGYSRLMAADEEGTLTRFRAIRSDLINPELEAAKARLIKTMGDGLLIEFPSPVAATRTSLAIQNAMVERERDQTDDTRIQFRIGINLGDVIIEGDDILGDGVNVAARLESLAPPGGICISRAVHEQVRGKIETRLTALGPQNVKNIPEPIDVWRVEVEGVRPAVAARKSAEPPSLVVLPFDNMSSDPEQEFLADGIVEDVTTELSRFRTLTVIARNSAFTYKGTPKDVRDIAKELGVRYVVEGSVRRAGDRLRVTAQLIEAETGAHLWAERWDRTMADLFDVQDQLTSAIVTGVEPELGAHERTLSRRKPTESLTAWELAQKGYSRFLIQDRNGIREAAELYKRALELDPNFPLACAFYARTYYSTVMHGWSEDIEQDLKAGLDLADRCIALDPRMEYGHAMRAAFSKMLERSRDAKDAFEIAENLNPNSVVLHILRGNAEWFGNDADPDPDPDVLEETAKNALRLSPRDPMASVLYNQLGIAKAMRHGGRPDAPATEAYEMACRVANPSDFALFNAAFANACLNRLDDASHYLDRLHQQSPGFTYKVLLHRLRHMPKGRAIWGRFSAELDKLVELGFRRE